ncbi:MAG TPA: zinc dependent phospholipase C family protein [Pirellulaceae bacterium]|nr:zinc dependent phospholipase C family protein [Pirellulaceae bacterium]
MPGMLVHHWLALRIWKHPALASMRGNSERETWNAFLCGSLGPDMGMFPGGEPLISDLAHYVRPGDLANLLVDSAGSDVERAFAWGWVAHVLADIALHPLVNRGVGQLLWRDSSREIPYGEDPRAHARVELGLDAAVGSRRADAASFSLSAVFDEGGISYLSAAFGEIYDGQDFAAEFMASQAALVRWSAEWQALAAIAARRFGLPVPQRPVRGLAAWAYWPAWILTAPLSEASAVAGLFRPVPPDKWMLDELDRLADEVERDFVARVVRGQSQAANINLDTGQVEHPAAPYPLTVRTLARWQARRKRGQATSTSGQS